ncbi:uncharacterized protein LOC113331064 [Papaver somniferum]|uniref:uncharacterized protein LOC113331064 n=1 Tax=Papaver somniferum TaxID=3469 RepID=UPI000E6F537F|nr:uncharacterized protein LOC113331064 [Papaver somniferum]
MRVLYWNINGVAKVEAGQKLRELVHDLKPEILCVAEPKIKFSDKVICKLNLTGFMRKAVHNSFMHNIGNLWILWSANIEDPVVVNMTRQAITIRTEGVLISFVHASYIQVFRRRLWSQLSAVDTTTPWLIMGDFNCVLRQDVKKGGREFTWTNGQSGVSRILSKLDRSIINEPWLSKFLNWRCKALPREVLIIQRLLGFHSLLRGLGVLLFVSKKMWFSHPDFLRMVEDSWKTPVYGNLDFIFPYKLKRLKEAIKLWNQTVFGNVNARLKQAQLKFEVACRNSDEDPFNTSKLNIMKDSLVAVQDVRMQHLTMFNINIRRSANTISELVTEDGVTISEPIQLRDHVVSYYESKFNGVELPIEDNLFDYEHESISLIERKMLDAIPSLDEIKSAVFDLGANSAPGPDGFSGCFYRHCWDIIQQDLHSAIVHAWTSKSIPKGSNSSLIILIAKVRGADSLRKYRPIGLSNFFFKIFTKILATRLGRVLNKLVSEEQVAFMKGRNIHENISLDSEMVNELHIKRKDVNLGLKLDISQAFDTVNWSFIMEGNMNSLRSLVKLLDSYQQASGQRVCREKSKIYFGGGSLSRRHTIAAFLGMEVTHFPDRYLGVKVMPGAVRYHHISNVVDQLKEKLSWPVKFIQQSERVIRNFLWSGDSNLSRAFVVGFDKVCSPVEEGGLGITSLKTMNKDLLMKLWWSIKSFSKKWARFLESKFTCRDGRLKMAVGFVILFHMVIGCCKEFTCKIL